MNKYEEYFGYWGLVICCLFSFFSSQPDSEELKLSDDLPGIYTTLRESNVSFCSLRYCGS